MFYTVFSTNVAPHMQWQSDLLEYSWKRVGQDGMLIRLVATDHPTELPQQKYAQCVATELWDIHPETGDGYPIYNKPASLLEWLVKDDPEGTVLLIDPDCIFRQPIARRVAPGFPASQKWINLNTRQPSDKHPFGFPPGFAFLKEHCARVDLSTEPVMIPTLIHTEDLRRICARWLELCGVIRQQCRNAKGLPIWESDMYAYVATCAEYGLRHDPISLGICTNWLPREAPDAPIVHYCQPILAKNGRQLFSKISYKPWMRVDTSLEPEFDYGKDLVAAVNGYIDNGGKALRKLSFDQRPKRNAAVMEGRVIDEILLEIPTDGRSVWLNVSGKATWDLCDGFKTIRDITSELNWKYAASGPDISGDVMGIIEQLHRHGFLEIR
jgi:hypothetical protein